MQRYYGLCVLVFLVGCVVLPAKEEQTSALALPALHRYGAGPIGAGTQELTSVNQAVLSMTREQVRAMMGPAVTIGFEKFSRPPCRAGEAGPPTGEAGPPDFTPIVIANPQRTEHIKACGKIWEVEYYFTRVQKPDGIISDDELTPLVFRDGQFVGRGWPFLRTIKP